MNLFEDVAETIGAAFNLDAEKTKLVKTGLVIVTVVIAARYVRGLLKN